MREYKVAIITESLSTHSSSRVAIELSKHLKRLGNNVSVYAYAVDKNVEGELSGRNIQVIELARLDSRFLSRIIPNRELIKLLKVNRPHVAILTAFLSSNLAAKLAGVPVLRIYMGTQFGAYLENKLPNQEISLLDRIANFTVDAFIYLSELISAHLSNQTVAISHYCAEEIERLYRRKVNDVIYLGGNHLPTETLKKRTRENRSSPQTLNLLSVSRVTPYKNFHFLIETTKKLSPQYNISLTIAGTVAKPQYLAYLKKVSPKNVHFIINPSDQQLARLYSDCDIYITADKYLFFGLPIAEAAFFKKPTIALNYAAAKELVLNRKTGLVVNNQKEIMDAITHYIKNKKSVQRMGLAAQKRAQEIFTWEKSAKQYLELFKKIV